MANFHVKFEKVTVAYSDENIIENFTAEFRGAGLIQIMGPNGAGKTTLLKTLLGLIKPISGRVYINDVNVTGNPSLAGKFVGYVPQFMAERLTNFPLTAWEIVSNLYILHEKKWPRVIEDMKVKERVRLSLTTVGLPKKTWFRSINELSGGQRQRVLIARAIVHDPPILVMDEPLASVDPRGRAELAELIGKMSKNKLIIITSHDPTLLLQYTTKVVLLNRKYYVIGTPDEVLKIEILSKVYGGSAIPIIQHIHISDYHMP
ncbi:MAG TPA: metal ABC transporter ATP-binding protein [Thermofilum sp.]|nr:metal ABC transporter ATP-binding protein [Thermofilum sp.]